MTTSARTRPLDMTPSWRKGKTSGWTAFDREQQRKKAGEPEAKGANFPSMSSSMDQIENIIGSTNNRIVLEKPFASVLRGTVNIPASGTHCDMGKKTLQAGNSNVSEHVNELSGMTDVVMAYDMLKKHHSWADRSLIEDVLVGVNNDVVKASALLKMMITSENNYEESSVTVTKELKSNCEESLLHKKKSSVDRATDLTELSCLLEGVKVDNKEFQDEKPSSKEMLIHDDLHTEASPNFINHVPIEPEWEEDDVYLVHRKDARRMMSCAIAQMPPHQHSPRKAGGEWKLQYFPPFFFALNPTTFGQNKVEICPNKIFQHCIIIWSVDQGEVNCKSRI